MAPAASTVPPLLAATLKEAGGPVLLVDDVTETGWTLAVAARMLRRAGAEGVLPLLADKQMKPPVALLVYATDDPKEAVYYPFAEFSPEYQAIVYCLKRE